MKKKRACFGFTYKLQNDMTPLFSTTVPCTILLSLLSLLFFFFNLMSMECFQFPQKENASRKQRLECLVPSVISFLYTFILPESYSVLTI